MKLIKEKTVAFTGECTLTTATEFPDRNLENVIRTELYFVIEDCYREGKNIFLCSIEKGFNLLASSVVLELRKKFPDVQLIAVTQPVGQEERFSPVEQLHYDILLQAAGEGAAILQSVSDQRGCSGYGDFVIAGASEVIAYSNSRDAGVKLTIEKAKEKGIGVLNLFDELENYFAISHPAKRYLQQFPSVTSFRFGREGVLFHGYKQAIPVPFTEIASVTQKGRFLEFALKSGVTYKASIFTDECIVTQTKSRFERN